MTPAVPDVLIDYDDRWISVEVGADLEAWATRAAGDLLARPGSAPGDPGALAATLRDAAAILTRTGDAIAAYLLCPGPDRAVRAGARFVLAEIDPTDDETARAAVRAGLLAVDATLAAPPQVDDVETPAGVAVRVVQRLTANDVAGAPVSALVTYGWPFPDTGSALVLSSGFADLLEAGRWQPALDALARGVRLRAG